MVKTAPARARRVKGRPRSMNSTIVSVSCTPSERAQIQARAESLGLHLSTYLMALARRDCEQARELVITPRGMGGAKVERVPENNG